MKVDNQTPEVIALEAKRKLPRTLLGGTAAMRAEGETYLPKEIKESVDSYKNRLKRSFLFNGFGKTVRDMTSKVFSKPIVISEDMDKKLLSYCEDIDLAGRNLDVFAEEAFKHALVDGISYILVEMPPSEKNPDGTVASLTVAQAAKRRPWAVLLQAEQVLGWMSEVVDGVEQLTQFRFKEAYKEPVGEYGYSSKERVRCFRKIGASAVCEVHEMDDKGAWVLTKTYELSLGKICIVPVYNNRKGFMAGEPALLDLAEINQAHWQSQSDQRNILHVARVPILFGAGLPTDGEPMEIGAGRMIRASDPSATLAYVEHSGTAIESGRTDLKDLEFQMQVMGLELLIPRPSHDNATGASIDYAKMNTPLASMALSEKDALEQMFVLMAEYSQIDLASAGSLEINTDYGVQVGGAADVPALSAALAAGAISRKTYLHELKRRNILRDDLDIDQEVVDALEEVVDRSEENQP